MGGTIIRLASQGHNILLLDMTNGEPTPHGSPEQRQVEWNAALDILNSQAANGGKVTRRLLGLPNREITHSIQARHRVAGVIREHQPDIIFLPFFQDAHPDHIATTRIVEDARFDAKLTKTDLPGQPIYPKWMFYYYCTHLRWVADPSFCLDITEQMDAKEKAITAYETQFVIPEKNRRVVQFVREMNGYMGSRIATRYAEPFHTKEPLGLTTLDHLA